MRAIALGVILIIFLAVIIIVCSLISEKRRINRALEEGEVHSRKSGPDSASVTTGVVYAVIIIFLIVICSKIDSCEEDIRAVDSSVRLLRQQVEWMHSEQQQAVEKAVSLLDGCDWYLKDCDLANNTATVHFSVRLKAYAEDTAVTLDYYGKTQMQPLSNGTFEADVKDVPLFGDGTGAPGIIVHNGGSNASEELYIFKRNLGWYAFPHLYAAINREDCSFTKTDTFCCSFCVVLEDGQATSFSGRKIRLITECSGKIVDEWDLSSESGWYSDDSGEYLDIRDYKINVPDSSECRVYLEGTDDEGFIYRYSIVTVGREGKSSFSEFNAEERRYDKDGRVLASY